MSQIKKILLSTLCAVILFSCIQQKDMYIRPGEVISFKFEKSKNPGLPRDIELEVYSGSQRIATYLTEDIKDLDLSSLIATFKTENGKLHIGSIPQESGKTPNDFSKPVRYTCIGDNEEIRAFIVNIAPYTGLPVAIIRTENEIMVKDKKTWMNAQITIDGMGKMQSMSGSTTVKGRGNGSWKYPKKPFNIKLSEKQEVLGMPKQKNWAFLANYRDRTLLRNDVTFQLGYMADNLEWTPKCQYVEVLFNGEYQGNFLICERIRVDKNRVNIKEMTTDDIDEESITGGYILEYDKYYDEVNKFKTALNNWPVNINEPDEKVLNEKQFKYIQDYTNKVEELLSTGNFDELYNNYIDINSFIDYWIVQALCGNTEMYNIYSVYCYKHRNGKMFAGPLWDFDYSTYVSASGTNSKSGVWFKYLFESAVFKQKVKERFAVLKPRFETIPQYIASKSQYLSTSVEENWKLWPISTSYIPSSLNKDETLPTYQEAIDRMTSIYQARLSWLESDINKL